MEQHTKGADSHALFLVIPLLLGALSTGLWLFYQAPLYIAAAKFCHAMLWPFAWVPAVAQYRASIIYNVLSPPSLEQLFIWLQVGFAWPAVLAAGLFIFLGIKGVRHPIVAMFRGALTPDALMRHQATVFSAIAPLIPIARNLHRNQDPRWHEAYHPHTFIQHFKLTGEGSTLNLEATEKVLLGQLGRRLCKHGEDPAGTVFVDRMNNYEKTVFALLAPLALKRKEGVAEYTALRDALNYSADPKTQIPQLTLASASYALYRAEPRVQSLAQRHPYSVTFLMELFALAKQSGRVTTVEFLGWLRPNQTGLYFALNTVGRRTPFAESTGSYAQWLFEKHCVKTNALPIKPCVSAGLMGLQHEWQQYCASTDEHDEAALWGSLAKDPYSL